MDKQGKIAVSLVGLYLATCVLALWHRIDALLVLGALSPVAASLMFPKDGNIFTRMMIGAGIDAVLAALAFVPLLGDLIDLGASVVALVLLVVKFRQLASSLPGGLACLLLYLFVWSEAGFLPHRLSVSGVPHEFWFYPAVIVSSIIAGAAILAVLTALLRLLYEGDWAKALFCAVGFLWYLLTFFLTIFLPNGHVKRAHQSVASARRA
jgi:hypothetical protein